MVREHTLYDLHPFKIVVTCFMGYDLDCLSKCVVFLWGYKVGVNSIHAYLNYLWAIYPHSPFWQAYGSGNSVLISEKRDLKFFRVDKAETLKFWSELRVKGSQLEPYMEQQWQILFSWAPKSLWTLTATMKLKYACPLEEKLWQVWTVY